MELGLGVRDCISVGSLPVGQVNLSAFMLSLTHASAKRIGPSVRSGQVRSICLHIKEVVDSRKQLKGAST